MSISSKWISETESFDENGYWNFVNECAVDEEKAISFFDELKVAIESKHVPTCISNKSRGLSITLPPAYLATQAMAEFRRWSEKQGLVVGLGCITEDDDALALLFSPKAE